MRHSANGSVVWVVVGVGLLLHSFPQRRGTSEARVRHLFAPIAPWLTPVGTFGHLPPFTT